VPLHVKKHLILQNRSIVKAVTVNLFKAVLEPETLLPFSI
jgi:hypothetical protein